MDSRDLLTQDEMDLAEERARGVGELLRHSELFDLSGESLFLKEQLLREHLMFLEQELVGQPLWFVGGDWPPARKEYSTSGKRKRLVRTFYPPAALVQVADQGHLSLRLWTAETMEQKVTQSFMKSTFWKPHGTVLIRWYHSLRLELANLLDTRPYTVYALVDPRTAAVRYIGISNDPYKRYQHHCAPSGLTKATPALHRWLCELAREGLQPGRIELETNICGMALARKREHFWIRSYQARGVPLCNYIHNR